MINKMSRQVRQRANRRVTTEAEKARFIQACKYLKLKVGTKIKFQGEEGEVTFIGSRDIQPNHIHIVYGEHAITERVMIDEIEIL